MRNTTMTMMLLGLAAVLLSPAIFSLPRGPGGGSSWQADEPAGDEGDGKAEQAYQRAAPPGASERIKERTRMVETQIEFPLDGRLPIRDKSVLEAARTVPRHAFVPKDLRSRSYQDSPLPIGYGQTISQPYIVALMTELLDLTSESKVLEIGTGSGYQAAMLAQLTPKVYTVEIIKELGEQAAKTLKAQGYEEVRCKVADGYYGWEDEAPFDAIIVTCAAGHLPPPLWEQLKPGGRIVIPIGGTYEVQRLVVVTKKEDGSRESRTVTSVRFVPLTRGTDK
jgi:protein-L-isoaspartate(D-aspartate) O-methyltransferase